MNSGRRALVLFVLLTSVLLVFAMYGSALMPPRDAVLDLPPEETSHVRATPNEKDLPQNPDDSEIRLLKEPTLSQTSIAFVYAGEIWSVPREGGVARRLVTGQYRNHSPIFSPDGRWIAFTATQDNNTDVYVVPAGGGEPQRVTYHPNLDEALGWSPDGMKILFSSMRRTVRDLPKLFLVSPSGGFPEEVPLPSGGEAAFSPDGKQMAYVPIVQWQPTWRKYRGGQTTPIWIANLADSHITKIPRDGSNASNDRQPMWIGDQIYFLSDRAGSSTLFSYDLKSSVKQAIPSPPGNERAWDIRNASAGPGAIVYEQLGAIKLFDLASHTSKKVDIDIDGELSQTRPGFVHVDSSSILHAAISPTGKRVLVEAHGEILSVPTDKGDVRNLTRSPSSADRDPAWSPDGKWVAWLSDEAGEYALYFRSPDGLGPQRKIELGAPPSFFYTPRWSPDSKKIALTDKRLNLWLVDIDHPTTPAIIDTDKFEGAQFDHAWSPDSKWIAYAKQLENHLHAIFVYSLADKKATQVTDGRSDVLSPRFDRSGKYLYFIARTDLGMGQTGGMTAMARAVTGSIYAAVLSKDQTSPLAPESDEEDAGAKSEDAKKKSDGKDVKIDFDGIDQRIIALPLERTNYTALEVGTEGVLFALSGPIVMSDEDYIEFDEAPPPNVAWRFDMTTRKSEKYLDEVDGFDPSNGGPIAFSVSADGTKVLYEKDSSWFVVSADKPQKAGDGALKGELEVFVDPRQEWRQIFHEVWRIERDFLYDPNAHGLDLAATEKLYAPFVSGLGSRSDLNMLLEDALGYLVLGHVWAYGGTSPKQPYVSGGLLGADYRITDGRYQIARVLRGENWNPKLRAPLTQPGLDVHDGDFILNINGRELHEGDDIDQFLLERAGKQTVITIASSASGAKSRQITVVPASGEGALRLRTWMEDSRKKVTELSNGRVGYAYIPDTAGSGLTNFDRYYFSEIGKDAIIIDERFNHGGQIADYMVNILASKPIMGAVTRQGEDVILPSQAIFGPKVMLANEMSGSGGDALPWMFKMAKAGTLVGARTWGGLVGIGGYPKLIDGGKVTAPRWGLYGLNGDWVVENHGIAPDVEVEQDPALVRKGHDPQLERAVQIALDELAKNPPPKFKHPPFSNYGPRLPTVAP